MKIARWVWILAVAYIVIFSALSIVRHEYFYSGWDLGMNEQVLWNTKNGHFFYNDDLKMNYLGNHFNLIFLLLMPIYYLFTYTGTMLIIQAAAIGLGIIPIYLLARMKLKSKVAQAAVPVAYALNFVLWQVNLEDFHPITLAVPLILFAAYFMEKGDWKKYWIFLVITLMVQEDISLIIIFLGLFIFFFRSRSAGAKTVLTGIIWFIVVISIVSPILNQGGNAPSSEGKYIFYTIRYSYLGDSTLGIIKTIITNPVYALTYTSISNKLFYIGMFIIMFAGLPLLSEFSLVAIPLILQNTLTTDVVQICPNYHHSIMIVPIFMVAAIFASSRIEKKKYFGLAVLLFILISVIFSAFIGVSALVIDKEKADSLFMNGQRCFNNEFTLGMERPHPELKNTQDIRSMIDFIPNNTTIISSQHLFSHMIKKGRAVTGNSVSLTRDYEVNEEYVIIDATDIWNIYTTNFLSKYERKGYKKIFEKENLSVFRKEK